MTSAPTSLRSYVVPQNDDYWDRIIPPWWDELHPHIREALKKKGIHKLFAIQKAAIPTILGRESDACVAAPTGQGKTLCYLIPLIHLLIERQVPRIRALILVPTRELTFQVQQMTEDLINGISLRCEIFCKGESGTSGRHRKSAIGFSDDLNSTVWGETTDPPDIAIATPGAFLRQFESPNLRDRQMWFYLEFLVLDESDRLLKLEGAIDWIQAIRTIENQRRNQTSTATITSCSLPLPRLAMPFIRKFLFSATVGGNPSTISALGLERPMLFLCGEGGSFVAPQEMSQFQIRIGRQHKGISLLQLFYVLQLNSDANEILKIVVFCSRKETTHKVARMLQFHFHAEAERHPRIVSALASLQRRQLPEKDEIPGSPLRYKVAEFSAKLTAPQRKELFADFAESKFNILVASDVVARGVDIADADVVVNFDLPRHVEGYVHRCGRVARAGRWGLTATLVSSGETRQFREMQGKMSKGGRAVPLTFKKSYRQDWAEHHGDLEKSVANVLRAESNSLFRYGEILSSSAIRRFVSEKSKETPNRRRLSRVSLVMTEDNTAAT